MSTNNSTMPTAQLYIGEHPAGLYALFGIEMWERFSFYSMLALFTLYMRDTTSGFGWTAGETASLYANYMFFVYFSPWIGGLIADRITGYRKAVMIGGVFFIIGHALLSIHALWAVYAALTALVIGNGFFKPNVSAMVGNLYPEGSLLKDRAFNIFYMGINLGGFLAPLAMAAVEHYAGYHAAFAVAAFGMVISVAMLRYFKNLIENPEVSAADKQNQVPEKIDSATAIVDVPPSVITSRKMNEIKQSEKSGTVSPIDLVPAWKRIVALIIIFAIVIVFWMAFHQNGLTLTFWADDNTDWQMSGIVSNSINSFWVIILTFPLVWFWQFLDRRGREPSTPTKMVFGMLFTGLSFLVLFYAAMLGEGQMPTHEQISGGSFRINERTVKNLAAQGVPSDVLEKIVAAKDDEGKNQIYGVKFAPKVDENTNRMISGEQRLMTAVETIAPEATAHRETFLQSAYLFRVSAFWLILAYAILTLGELMLSPMGLSLVSKVAPVSARGLLMGGWFMATAIGNKLTQIGVYWDIWLQSSFFLVLAGMSLVMAVVLFLLLKPLKKAMPGV